MQPVPSPWIDTFESFVRSIRDHAIVVTAFITAEPLRQFASLLDIERSPQISLLTNLAADSLLQGTVGGHAVAEFCREVPTTLVRHLPGLHAKAYVADEHTAIVTSGNLTRSPLHRNAEYGVQIRDPTMVRRITKDLQEYGGLGAEVSLKELDSLAEISETLRDKHAKTLDSTSSIASGVNLNAS